MILSMHIYHLGIQPTTYASSEFHLYGVSKSSISGFT